MLDLNKLFNNLEDIKYFITKIDVPYVPQDFPSEYAVGKDVDLIVDKIDYDKIQKIVKEFASLYDREFEQNWIDESDGFRLRFENNNSLHFQIDVTYLVDDESLENRIKKSNYYITKPIFECKFRNKAYQQDKSKEYHYDWMKKNNFISIKDFMKINKDRMDIYMRLLYIEDSDKYYNLYKKTQLTRNPDNYENASFRDVSLKPFNILKESFEKNSYDIEYPVIITDDFKLYDGSHRIACCLYHNISFIPYMIEYEPQVKNIGFDIDWFIENNFSEEEIRDIRIKRESILHKLEI